YDLGVDSATVVSGFGSETISSGGVAHDTRLAASGTQFVLSGGAASLTIVSSTAVVSVSSGGVVTNATLLSGGTAVVLGTDGFLAVSNGGQEFIWSGGVAFGDVLSSGGRQTVSLGGTASNTT